MDLHTGTSLWQAGAPPLVRFPPLEGSLATEVAVIGGGVTGALVAQRLVREGVATVLVDKRQPCGGSTAASTGLLLYEIDVHLCDLARKVGWQRAVHAYRRGLTAIDELEQLVADLGLDCGFGRRDSLYLASHRWHLRRLRKEFDCRREFDFPVALLDRAALRDASSINAAGAIRSTGDAQLDPYRFTQQVLRHAIGGGLRVFGDTAVLAAEEGPAGVTLQTDCGRLACQAAVFATGYEAHEQLASPPGNLQSTYVVAGRPADTFPGWPDGCLIWETARPYSYARQTDDGRAMIGGGDTAFAEDHTRDALLERKTEALAERFGQLFPEIDFVPDYAWGGTFAETKDGLAYIGRPQGKKRTYFAMGYGGNGITFSAIAARLIADQHLGRPNADAEVFSWRR
jgi:glycine/D-amino acid oxidase-like deaminating enzyme